MKNGRNVKSWLAAAMMAALAGSVWAQQMAPVNPAFARWQRERAAKEAEGKKGPERARPRGARAAAARGEAGGEDMDFGFVPTVLDMGYLSNLNDNLAQGVGDVLEPAYDLREAGALTAVRDQGSYGNCWAFAAMGSLESWVKKSEGTELDLSENHLVNLHGWSQGFGAGGNAQMAEGYFLRWAGPVAESEDAYPRPGKSVAGTPVRHVQRVRWIPGRTAYLDNDGIKQALKSWGALQADYYHAGSYYNAKTASYYFNPGTSYRLSNHAVDLVGWDDNYSKKNFKPEPPGDGAYIVRNSWGSAWGEGGYFHISYYDESFAWKPLYSFSGTEAADNYDAVYQHDPLGMVGAIGYAGPTAWGANVFTAAEASKVAAAGFYAMTPRTTYTLMVYTGCRAGSPRSGTLAAQQSGTVDAAGYVTVPLETPAAVSAGQRFSVVVQLTTPGYAYPLAVEYAVAGYSAAASAKEGESYLSANGSKWDDFTARVASTANFCCKAYVKSAAVVRSLAGLSIEGVNSLKAGSSAVFTCTAAYSDGSTKTVSPRWSIAEGGKWASVDSSGRVTAKATGEQRTVKLRASYSEGGVSKTAEWSFFVTVAAPAAPADLEATAGTEESCVRLSWTASEGAAGYAVYRGTRESSGNAAYLGTVTATRYADTAAVPGVDYRYFVKAKNGSGSSPFSPGAWGWRALAAPANLSASDGTRDDRVDVAWNRSEGASHYRVWRADGADGEPVAVSPWQTACQYADTSAEAGMPHLYYATAAVDAEGTRESAFGVPDEGFRTGPPMLKTLEISGPVSLVSGGRGTYTCTAVSTDGTRTTVAPEWTLSGGSLAVSDGKAVVTAPVAGENTTVTLSAAYSDGTANRTGRLSITVTPAVPPAPAALELVSATERGIALRWSAVANATSYQLWRSGPGEDSAVVASTTATEHTDASAAPGVAYAYRVGAANAAGAGAPGSAVVEAVRPVAAPTGVSASYGTYADKVAVSWKACEGAEFYRVWRADSADGAKTALGAWQTALAFDDTTATAGTVHYYSVQAAVDETGTAASAFGGPAVGLRKISPKPVALTILGPDRVAAESTAAYTAKVRYENGAVASVVPVWSIASGGTFATIGSDGLLTVGKLEEDRTIVVTARFIDGATVEGSLEVVLVAPIVQTASVKDVEAHARWPWNGWVDVDYTLETAPTGTVAKVTLSGYDNDHKSALAATTLSGDGARGARVAPGKRRISWNLGADYPDFHASRVKVLLDAIPIEPIDPDLQNGGLAAAFFDLNSSALPYSAWNTSYNDMREFFATRSPAIVTNTVYVGDTFDFGASGDSTSKFPGKYSQEATEYFTALLWGTIDIPQTGTFQFRAVSDDGIALYIDQKLVFGATGVRSMANGQYGADAELTAGLHEIAIAFHECDGGQGLQMYWQSPTASELTLLPQSVLYYTDPAAECFTVRFSANGGTGSMSDWMCNPNFAAMLPANTFKRSGFTFVGWATSASDAVEFTDGQDVTGWDVAAGETVTLYAVWKEIEAGELPTKGLVAYYSFNGNLNDESGNGYHLTNSGGTFATDRFGNANHALAFDGKEHHAGTESFEIWNSFSVSCWVKTDVSKDHSGTGEQNWAYGNYPMYPAYTEAPGAGVGFKSGIDGISIVEHGPYYQPVKLTYNANIGNGWNQICFVVENDTGVRVYLNGKFVDSGTLSARTKRCMVSCLGGTRWACFTGSIDDLCVYDRVLSDDEVDQVYRAGLADGGDEDEPVTPVVTADWYVSAASGNDSNDGRSWAKAKKTIQAAIDASSAGETILVGDGTYEPITTDNKAISISSVNGAEKTIIDGGGSKPCAHLWHEGDSNNQRTHLTGFTLRNGYSGAYTASGAQGGTIRRCIFTGCSGGGYGGSSGTIGADVGNCLFYGNKYRAGSTSSYVGGSMFPYWGGGVLANSSARNCTVVDNEGYGLWDGEAYNCIVVNNTYDAYVSSGCEGHYHNCRFTSTSVMQVGSNIGASVGGNNNTYGAVTFANASARNYRLVAGSPCIDAGDNSRVPDNTDFDGNARIANGTVDIGCYEYASSPVVSSLSDGLVAYWPFDGDARDASGNGNDLNNNNAILTEDRNGNANHAYSFDGENTVMTTEDKWLVDGNSFSFSVWAKTEQDIPLYGESEYGTEYDNNYLLFPINVQAEFNLPNPEDGAGIGLAVGKNAASVYEHSGWHLPVVLEHVAELGTGWNHYVVTVNNNGAPILYVNGQYVKTGLETEYSKRFMITTNSGVGGGGYGHFCGSADELAVWRRALTADEVARLYAGEKPVASEHGLTVRYYDHTSSLSISDWASQVTTLSDCKAFYATLVPSLVTNSLDIGDTLDFGSTKGSFCNFHGKYATQGTEYFSIVLSGQIQLAESGTYTFSIFHDDGCVMFIDGKAGYSLPGGTSSDQFRSASVELEAGRHEILIACHEYAGDQILRIRMKAPSDSALSGLPQSILYQKKY